jgi:Putative peptidoglycan binding domain
MRWALALAFLAFVVGLPCAAVPAKTKSTVKKTSTTAKSPSVRKTSAGKGSAGAKSRRRAARKPAGPTYQTHPDTGRYQEIQQALTERGYYKGEANGQWNDDSVEALKHFQADQKMEPDGKINSLSLIGLGLGPKHDGSTVASSSTPAQ